MFQKLIDKTSAFFENKIQGLRMEAQEQVAKTVPGLVLRFFQVLVTALFVLFLFTGVAFWLGELLDHPYWGFFIVAGFFAIVAAGAALAANSKSFKKAIQKKLEQKWMEEEDEKAE